jgi:pimeloyl-ACP methyl ester carboxylesterase
MRLAAKWQASWRCENGYKQRPENRVRIRGEWVEVIRLGRGDPLVLVPGLAGSWRLLWPLARRLARHFEVIVAGLYGDCDGWSGPRGHFRRLGDLGEYAEDLAALIDRLGLSHPALFGVSFGGAIALEFAARHPQGLGALIVHGAAARFRPTVGSVIARRVLERFPLPSDNRFINQFFHLLYGMKPEPGPLVDFVIERIWETDQGVMAKRMAQLETFDVTDRLWRIDVPTLVLAGSRDVIVPPVRQQALAEAIPGARFEAVEGAGHIGFLTHRDEVVRRVRKHLRPVEAVV